MTATESIVAFSAAAALVPVARSGPGRRQAGAALLVTLLVSVAGCSPSASGAVEWVGAAAGTRFGLALPLPKPGSPLTVLVGPLCRTGTQAASVTAVTFDNTDGIALTGFATRARGAYDEVAGAETKELGEAGYNPSAGTVSSACGDQASTRVTHLAIQVTASQARRVRASGLTITYSAGATTGTLRIPMTLILCLGLPEGQRCAGE